MTLNDAKKLLAENGIYQLNKGESLQDALDYVNKKIEIRKGYKFKHNDGSLMSENQVIQNENKEAFKLSFTPATYSHDDVESIDDICDADDYRENKNLRGMIVNCFYCGGCIRCDGDEEDYSVSEPEIHCDDCMNDAIMKLAM